MSGSVTPEAAHRDHGADLVLGFEGLQPVERFLLTTLERLDVVEEKVEQLQVGLEHSRIIGAAVGIIMATRRVSRESAFQHLRDVSMTQNRKLFAVAEAIVATHDFGVADRRSRDTSG